MYAKLDISNESLANYSSKVFTWNVEGMTPIWLLTHLGISITSAQYPVFLRLSI